MKLHTLALVAGLMMSGGASATVNLTNFSGTNLGLFGAPELWSEAFSVSNPGAFEHSLTFAISENLYAGSGVMDISLAMPLGNFTLVFTNIDNLSAEIFSGSTSYATFSQVGDSDHLALPMGTYFAAGNYTLQIGGTATGSGSPAGFYNVAAVTAPVPEPETWGMLLAGAGLIGLRMRQRRRASRQAAIG